MQYRRSWSQAGVWLASIGVCGCPAQVGTPDPGAGSASTGGGTASTGGGTASTGGGTASTGAGGTGTGGDVDAGGADAGGADAGGADAGGADTGGADTGTGGTSGTGGAGTAGGGAGTGGTSGAGAGGGTGGAPTCTTTLNAGANLESAISGAAGGSTICLNSGSYPSFTLNGVVKTPRVTVVALTNRAATSSFTISGSSSGLTLDGFTFTSGLITGANTREITVRNSAFTGQLRVDGLTSPNPNLLLDNNTHDNISAATAPNARLHFSYSEVSTGAPVATIQNSRFEGSCSDGIQTGVPIVVVHNQFRNLLVGSCPNDPHTDALQFYGGPFAGTVVRENYFVNNEQVLTAYDGVDNLLIEGNVFDPGTSAPRPCQIELYSDTDSIVRHNTLLGRGNNGQICLDHKSSDPAGTGTVIDNNIATAIVRNGSTTASNINNLLASGGGGGNLSGTPVFQGGTLPSSWAGFALTATSPGKGVGTHPTGSDIGASFFGL